jgi:gliding motility-associated-like protein
MQLRLLLSAIMFFGLSQKTIYAQSFSPVAISGFNQDVIAEGGPSSLATTTFPIDGVTSSNMIIYTETFRAFAGISGGGITDNGIITDAAGSYQLAPYTGNNTLLIARTQSGDLNFITPNKYSRLRVLSFSAEGASLLNATVYFTDGSSTSYLTNYSLADWFNSTTNVVISGYGRCRRVATAPYGEEAYPVNPRMYYMEIILSCTDQLKNIQKIHFDNVSPSSTGSIYPNALFFAISGISYSQTVTSTITPSDCSGPNGSIALNVTGSSSSYTYSWNTTPVQTGSTTTGLAPGPYTCTITDANGCNTNYDGTVTLNNNAVMTASANPAAVCPGTPVQLTANVTTGILTTYIWTPGNLNGQSVSVSPVTTTPYTVTATNSIGCTASAQITVTVNAIPNAPVVNNVTVCSGANAVLQVQSPIAGETYNWFTTGTGGSSIATGTSCTVNNATVNAIYYVEAVNGTSCISAVRTPASVIINANAALPAANDATVCPGDNALLQIQTPQPGFTYNWYSATAGGTPLSTGISYTLNNVTAVTTIYVDALNASSCASVGRSPVNVSLFQQLASPVVTVSTVSFSSVTFSWPAVPGAVGYEITTDGGATYQSPSSGTTGTTHTISGLTGNQTVSIQVRALGPHVCETSELSFLVSGTTLSSKEIFVPNVFTPNGDGKNDVLFVYGNYMASIQFKIFNQWGEMIFSSQSAAIGWDGSYKGKQQPVGVYVYALKAVLQDGVVVNKKGSVNLIR